MTGLRSFNSSCFASAGVLQISVPTSTIDWCSSALICSFRSNFPSSRICVMYDFNSPVFESMIWYSSSIPMVSDGACIRPPLARFDQERRHGLPPAGGHIDQGLGRDPGQAAVHVLAEGDIRVRVEHSVKDREFSVLAARERFVRQSNAALDDMRRLDRRRERSIPLRLIYS